MQALPAILITIQQLSTSKALGISSNDLEFDPNRVIERPIKKKSSNEKYRASIMELDSLMASINPTPGNNLNKRVSRLEYLVNTTAPAPASTKSLGRSYGLLADGNVSRTKTVDIATKYAAAKDVVFNVLIKSSNTSHDISIPVTETFSFLAGKLDEFGCKGQAIVLKTLDMRTLFPADPVLLLFDPELCKSPIPILAVIEANPLEIYDSYGSDFQPGDSVQAIIFHDFWGWRDCIFQSAENSKICLSFQQSNINVSFDLVRPVYQKPVIKWDPVVGMRVEAFQDGCWFAAVIISTSLTSSACQVRGIPGCNQEINLGVRSLKWRLRGFKSRNGTEFTIDASDLRVGWSDQLANKFIG